MVLPGIRGDQKTPGGMPDSGTVNPGGPMPSVPQNRGQSMGAGVQGPDPAHIEELFIQYTSGQITREDLVGALHDASEGQGGILGLLESMQGQGEPAQPAAPTAVPPPANGQAISPGAASVPIPSLEEPLDKRHQKISLLLQAYGLGPADADQMSTILNPHVDDSNPQLGHGATITRNGTQKTETDDTGSVIDLEQEGGAWGPSASETKSTYSTGLTQYEIDRENKRKAAIDYNLEGGAFGPSAIETASTYTTQPTNYEINRDVDPILEGGHWGPSATETAQSPKTIPTVNIAGDRRNPNLDVTSTVPSIPIVNRPEVESAETVEEEDIVTGLPEDVDLSKNMHPGVTGMPTTWGVMPGKQGGRDYNTDYPYEDPDSGLWFPTKAAYNLFQEKKTAFFQGQQQVIFTKDGIVDAVFLGWEPNTYLKEMGPDRGWKGGPMFGIPGQKDIGPFPAKMPNGDLYYFSNEADQSKFLETQILPDGRKVLGENQTKIVEDSKVVEPEDIITSDDAADKGWTKQPSGDEGGYVWLDKDGTVVATEGGDGKINPVENQADTPPDTGTGTGGGYDDFAGPLKGADLNFRSIGNYPMMDEFLQQLNTDFAEADSGTFSAAIAGVIRDLEIQSARGDIEDATRRMNVGEGVLERAAILAREQADRKLSEGVATGAIDIEGIGRTRTLAQQIEDNAMVMKQAALSGVIPSIDANGNLTLETQYDAEGDPIPTGETLEARQINATIEEKNHTKDLQLASLFGTWMPLPDKDASGKVKPEVLETLESQKFGLTRAITEAEISGRIPRSMMTEGDIAAREKHNLPMPETMAAKRQAWERDVAVMNAETAKRKSFNELERMNVDFEIAQNKTRSEESIAAGKLAEAVEARKDATYLAKQKLDIEREKMKLDTLTALSNPATYLFAVRYGLLEQIGGVLGIDWGDDIITSQEVPSMIAPGTFPSLTDFQRATPSEREIMLAEVASSGGVTTDEAVRMIMEGAPGGRDIRRTSLVGVGR